MKPARTYLVPVVASERGFTLIEALVTLVILAALAGVVFPSMSRWYASVVARQSLGEMHAQLLQMSAVAVLTGHDISLDDATGIRPVFPATHRLLLPSGWIVFDSGTLRFLRTGLCEAGTARLRGGSGQEVRVSATVLCEIELKLQMPSATS